MHELETIAHDLERLPEPLLEGRVQLLVDGAAHLLEALGVVAAYRIESLLDGRAHRLEAALIALRQVSESLVLQSGHLPELRLKRLREVRQRSRGFRAA